MRILDDGTLQKRLQVVLLMPAVAKVDSQLETETEKEIIYTRNFSVFQQASCCVLKLQTIMSAAMKRSSLQKSKKSNKDVCLWISLFVNSVNFSSNQGSLAEEEGSVLLTSLY